MKAKETIKILTDTNRYLEKGRFSKLSPYQKKYLKRQYLKNIKAIYAFVALVVVETSLTLSLPILNHYYLEKSFNYLNYNKLFFGAAIIAVGIILYLVISYITLLTKQKITMKLVNDIRHYWYAKFLRRFSATYKDGDRMMVKMLYHVQLLKMGFERIINDGLSTLLLFIGLVVITFFINSKLFIILWLLTLLLLIVFLVSYFIGKYYITREQTFNTRIVSQLTRTITNQTLLTRQNRQEEEINELDKLIQLDTHFRIRRQLWINYSDRVLFGGILLTGLLLYIVQIYWPFMSLQNFSDAATSTIILGLFTKVIYGTSRIGIFLEPFNLGLKLSTPKASNKRSQKVNMENWKTLNVKSRKTKISNKGGYIKDLNISIKPAERILITGDAGSGKSTLANAIAGEKNIKSINFELNGERLHANQWMQRVKDIYLISEDIFYKTTVGSLIFGKDNNKITPTDITNLYKILGGHELFKSIFKSKDLLGKTINSKNLSQQEKLTLQIAHCLVNKKAIIILDIHILDQPDSQIFVALALLNNIQPSTTIIVFGSKNNDYFEYDQKYQISQNQVKKV